ncbi:MAG TPA: alpha-2-macroglobulin family protein [Devosia sp.]|nr:alpha-2-macroglobulin family protein [Devosia sp.]
MLGLIRSVASLGAALLMLLTPVLAADRAMTVLPSTDLPGFDYETLKGTTLDQCQQTCLDDNICHAFTFNTKAKWCFLKSEAAPAVEARGATSGTITLTPSPSAIAADREKEIPFPADYLVETARGFANDLKTTDTPPEGLAYPDLIASGDSSVAQTNYAGAMVSYRQALAINPNDRALWMKLADAALADGDAYMRDNSASAAYDQAYLATSAAINAFLRSESVPDRAEGLAALAHALELRQMYRESIVTYRASVALADNADVQKRLEDVVAQHGFRITSNDVDAEAVSPRICLQFSDPLPAGNTDLSSYIVVENAQQVAIETQQSQICITGVEHGKRYHVKVRAGLPSADGEALRNDVELDLYVADRSPFVAFANNAYVLPAGLGGGLPITSVNATSADVSIYRIGDRSIATAVRNGIFQGSLDGYSAQDVADRYGEQVFEGSVDLAQAAPNANATTAIPVQDAIGAMPPGAYVITAKVTGSRQEYWQALATQWFIVTDLGLTTISGEDGEHVFVRSLTSAQPVANAKVRLVAMNNEILGQAVTDADGRAVFAPGLARGEGGRAPQLLVAETDTGDYAFLDVSKPGFDLTDRGVEGRPSPGPLDVYAVTERGVYRPGETVFLTALLRDSHAEAVEKLPLTMELQRPDGVTQSTELISDQRAGGYFAAIPLNAEAMRGSWRIQLFADTKEAPLANVTFLVEDFEPERLAFDITAPEGPVSVGEPNEINVVAKYLYGATAPGLALEADAILSPTSTLDGYPGYTFGRTDDTMQTYREPLGVVGTTDEGGNAAVEVTLPQPQPTTRPLQAQIVMRLVDTNGRAIERSLTRPVLAESDRIGIKPTFSSIDGLPEGTEASFDIIAVAPTGETVDKAGLDWRISRIETNYQWYRDNGVWKWEAITTSREIANGNVDATASGPVTVGAQVDWGLYEIEVTSGGDNPTSSSYQFYAGYYYAEAGSDTPDTLKVGLDKSAYRAGETAILKLEPQFAGTALVMVVDDRIIDMKAVEVPEGGTSVELPVTDAWGPGAYVTALLYRPASAAEKRMPARALGLAFADVDPGERKLDVTLDVAKEVRPRQPVSVTVKLGNAAAGEEAYVAVAAVDVGILNLTNYKAPDPDGWYFGQRQLGVDIRDLYGRLIDPTQGEPGALRAGGDEGATSRLGTPPATSVLVAMHSGIVKVGADGTATVTFDMPDFSGTARLMAMAWTKKGVGHAQADVIVRDPVVVTMSPPRFLRLDDQSRLLVEINNVGGPAGTYRVQLVTEEGLATDANDQTVDLAAGGRTALSLGLTGTAIGDNDLTLIVTDPSGNAYVKQLTLGVRATSGPRTTSRLIPIEPGETVTVDKSYFKDLVPHSSALTLALGPIARLDVPGLLDQLDRYPYGCAEQVASRATPLLYLNEVASMLGLASDDELRQRIVDAIADELAKQNSAGGFGLWGPFSASDLWLDSYVTDFLLRAKAEGYDVPELALNRALDNLGNQVSYASDFDGAGQDIAYALYDLARAGRAAIGDLRYYLEARLDRFGSPLAKAQLGAALALYGDRARAAMAFTAAVADLQVPEPQDGRYVYRPDYGSRLRDATAVLALAAEFTPSGVDLGALTTLVADLRDHERWTSTQEDAWTLLAASALSRQSGGGTITIDGETLTGAVYRRYMQEEFDSAPLTIVNTGNQKTEMKVTITGIPATPPPAVEQGFTISRNFYTPDGSEADLSDVHQNDRFVVVLSMKPDQLGSGNYVVSDPLPAGFEIENPDLVNSAGAGSFGWLSLDAPTHSESRTDQYVAAFRFYSETTGFSTAYLVRAVSPGQFTLPGATVEDMYRPEFRANTEASKIEVSATGP